MTNADYAPIITPINVTSLKMAEVIAPSDLEAGYEFDAIHDGFTFKAKVPKGGIKEGERFSVPYPSENLVVKEGVRGNWKDGLFSFWRFGIFHPSFCNALFCPQVLTAQVMNRMRLNWLGQETTDIERKSTFKKIVSIVVFYFFLRTITAPPPNRDEEEIYSNRIHFVIMLYNFNNLWFSLYSLYIIVCTRRAVRKRYEIQEENCIGCEDLACAFFCGCCTTAQLARQTTDYETHSAFCCTDNGLPQTFPVLVV